MSAKRDFGSPFQTEAERRGVLGADDEDLTTATTNYPDERFDRSVSMPTGREFSPQYIQGHKDALTRAAELMVKQEAIAKLKNTRR